MKLVVDQGVLLRELSLIQGIIERKTTIPILANVLMTALEGGKVTVTATDLEVGFRATFEAKVDQPGRVAVNARRLHDIVRRMPSGNLGFRQDDNSLHLQCERIKYRLQLQPADQFPTIRSRDGHPQAMVNSVHLSDMIRRVLPAISVNDPGYSLGGALVSLKDDQVTMVATDGHRLALSRRPAEKVGKGLAEMLVPRKALAEVGKLSDGHEGDVHLWAASNQLFVLLGERELNTSLQEHRFPDYPKVLKLAQANDKTFELNTHQFRDALDRVAVLSQERTNLVKLDLAPDLLRVSATHPELGEAQEELSVAYNGQTLAIGFNAQYLVDFLTVAGSEKIRVSLGGVMSQGLFEPVRAADEVREDRYIVMPMALG